MHKKLTAVIVIGGLCVGVFLLTSWSQSIADSVASRNEGMNKAITVEQPNNIAHTGKQVPVGRSGMRMENPNTGEMEAVHVHDVLGMSSSTEGLVEVPLTGGGTKVDLKGRFRSMLKVREK